MLIILLVIPSGLGGLVLRLRDTWLSRVATARGMDVPGFTAPVASVDADVRGAVGSVPRQQTEVVGS